MYRNVVNDLASWYEEPKRKILYIKGALGVGKTWAIKDFATGFFESYIYIDLNKEEEIKNYISLNNLEPSCKKTIAGEDFPLENQGIKELIKIEISRLDNLLSARYAIEDISKCLLIFDNAEGLSNIDIFFHEYSRTHAHCSVCVVASTMEVSPYQYHYKDVFKIIRMRPMSFEEYLIAKKAHPLLAAISNNKSMPLKPFEEKSIHTLLKEYLLIGGMPEIVNNFIKHKDFSVIRKLQNKIIKSYEYIIYHNLSSAMTQRTRRIWKSVPSQLERDNKKFMYKYAEPNARAREYAEATQILCNLGFVRKLPRLLNGRLPLEENADYKSFELFFIDHGLLRAMFDLPVDENLTLLDIFNEKNGAIAEQYIFQELSNKLGYLYYWISGATARVPFVYESDKAAIPVDIQFVPRKKAQNIKVFAAKNENTDISLKISLEQVSLDKSVLNVPAYSLWTLI